MGVPVDEVVRRTIRHAQRMVEQRQYKWQTARIALTKLMADLESRHPADPALEPLRRYIESCDRVWSEKNEAEED
jgi:hypothetical protein